MNVRVINQVRVGSAFSVGAVLSGIFFFVAYLPVAGLQLLAFSALGSVSRYGNSAGVGTVTLITLGCIWFGGALVAALGGGIVFALYAFIYNITFNLHGGIKAVVSDVPN